MSKSAQRILAALIIGTGFTINAGRLAAYESQPENGNAKSIEQIGLMLRQMGVSTKATTTVSGRSSYLCRVDHGNWTFRFHVLTTPSGRTVFVTLRLGVLRSDVSPTVLTRLLQQGGYKNGKMYFAVNSRNVLEMHLPIDNRAITARALRRDLDMLFFHINRTKTLWRAAVQSRMAPVKTGHPRI